MEQPCGFCGKIEGQPKSGLCRRCDLLYFEGRGKYDPAGRPGAHVAPAPEIPPAPKAPTPEEQAAAFLAVLRSNALEDGAASLEIGGRWVRVLRDREGRFHVQTNVTFPRAVAAELAAAAVRHMQVDAALAAA